MLMLPASQGFVSEFPPPRHLALSGTCHFDFSGFRDPAGSNATAVLALSVTATHRLLYHDKVEIQFIFKNL
jgi:hypothetical protein